MNTVSPMQYSKSLKIEEKTLPTLVWFRKRKRKLASIVDDFESFSSADTFLGTDHCGFVIWSLYVLSIHQVISTRNHPIGLSENELITITFHQIGQSIGVNRHFAYCLKANWYNWSNCWHIGGICWYMVVVVYGGFLEWGYPKTMAFNTKMT